MIERLLIVGLGSIGQRHLRLVRELVPGIQIVALRHRGPAERNEAGADHSVTSLDDAISFCPQAAVVANPASHHVDVAMRLAQNGVHLLIEKPIATNSNGVMELIQLCRFHHIVLMMGYNLRFLPSLRQFRELIQARRVGRVLSVRAEVGQYLPSWRAGIDYRNTVSARATLGGGVLFELSHEIDYLRWLFGEVEWVDSILRKQSDLEIDVEDTAHLVMGFASEPSEIPIIATLNMDFVRHDVTRTCIVIGTTGSLRWDALAGTVDVFEQGGGTWRSLYAAAPYGDESYVAEWRHFLACVANGDQPVTSGDDGLAVLRVIEAARESSNAGRIMPIKHGDQGEKRSLVGE
jgi:predicted dehydrogenase